MEIALYKQIQINTQVLYGVKIIDYQIASHIYMNIKYRQKPVRLSHIVVLQGSSEILDKIRYRN